jgi:hypothetical protein
MAECTDEVVHWLELELGVVINANCVRRRREGCQALPV